MNSNSLIKHSQTPINGGIQRVDERDIVFARQDLFRYFGKESPQFQKYYQRSSDKFAYDESISKKIPLGGNNPTDRSIFSSLFEIMNELGRGEIVTGKVNKKRIDLNIDQSGQKIKSVAKQYGAVRVGIGLLDQNWVYSHVGCNSGNREGFLEWGTEIDLSHHSYAISLLFPMDLKLLAYAPQFPSLVATAKAYSHSAITAVNLAHYIREMGYDARAHHFGNYQVLAVPVAADCGLGELSRAGFLLNRDYGLAFRLSIVTTEMPLNPDPKTSFGVQSFCRQCLRCAEECPSGAIPNGEKTLFNGIWKWKLNEQSCYAYWHVNGTDCGICMAVCPWTKPRTAFHRFSARIASIEGIHQKWMAQANKILYKRVNPPNPPDFME